MGSKVPPRSPTLTRGLPRPPYLGGFAPPTTQASRLRLACARPPPAALTPAAGCAPHSPAPPSAALAAALPACGRGSRLQSYRASRLLRSRSSRLVLEFGCADPHRVARRHPCLLQRPADPQAVQPGLEPVEAVRAVQVCPLQEPLHCRPGHLEPPVATPDLQRRLPDRLQARPRRPLEWLRTRRRPDSLGQGRDELLQPRAGHRRYGIAQAGRRRGWLVHFVEDDHLRGTACGPPRLDDLSQPGQVSRRIGLGGVEAVDDYASPVQVPHVFVAGRK